MTLREHIKSAIKGDVKSFEYLVNSFQAYIISFAFGILRDYHLAEDAAQEAFILLYSNIRSLKEPSAFLSWLKKVTVSCCSRIIRKKKPETGSVNREFQVDDNPGTRLETEERMLLIEHSLNKLSEIQREAITLHYFMGKSYADIASLLGISEAAVTGRMHAGKKKLRNIMFDNMREYVEEIMNTREQFTRKVMDNVWNFSIEVPEDWDAFPPDPANSANEVMTFESNVNGKHNVKIWRNPHNPEQTLMDVCQETQQPLAKAGYGNFVSTEKTINSKPAVVLDLDYLPDVKKFYWKYVFLAEGTLQYTLGFRTTNIKFANDIFDRIITSFKILKENKTNPSGESKIKSFTMKRYVNEKYNLAIDVPERWNVFPPLTYFDPNELIRIESHEKGIHGLVISRVPDYPEEKAIKFRKEFKDRLYKSGQCYKFVNGEIKNGSNTILTIEYYWINDELSWHRSYFIPTNNMIYIIIFKSTNKSVMSDLFDHMAKSFTVDKDKIDNSQIISSGNKHYKDDKWNFELDIPAQWNSCHPTPFWGFYGVTGYQSIEDGYHSLNIYRQPFDPELGVAGHCDQVKRKMEKEEAKKIESSERNIGTKNVNVIECRKVQDKKTYKVRVYVIPNGSVIYLLGFVTSDKKFKDDLFDSIVASFKIPDKQ